ncbi:TetR family transcriptional regulator C-terminal domain-containing protein [Pseudonocardia tropica]|uniref:TetR family transcriptional regulator C-terminal domain-containing protein n=1 Tax=Pseudonocardia tropica TaxID=681289 RepID=A0ABV1K0A6_9PSEU
MASELPMEEIVRRGARTNFEGLRESSFVPLFLTLWGRQASDDHVRQQLKRHYESVTDHLVGVYADFFESQGWDPRPPFTIRDFAVTLTALVEGLTVRWAVDPDAVPLEMRSVQSSMRVERQDDLDAGPWDLFGIVVLALIPSMTVPRIKRDSELWADHEDVRGLVRRLRETWESMVGLSPPAEAPDHTAPESADHCGAEPRRT